jgi:carbon-monoxide dehydrogenase iron sulfur subunit
MANLKENKFIYADPSKCLGCKSCEMACALAHAGCDLETAVAKQMQLKPRNIVVQVGATVVPIQCRQCEDAPCAHVCPVGALCQEDGLVKLNRENCVGCKVCAMVCPFGSIVMATETIQKTEGTRTNKARALKCDLCFSRHEKVTEEACACVQACPTQALALIDYESYRQMVLAARVQEIAKSRASGSIRA